MKKNKLIHWKRISEYFFLSNVDFEGTRLYFSISRSDDHKEVWYDSEIDVREVKGGCGYTTSVERAKKKCEQVAQRYIKQNIKDTERRLRKLKEMVD